MATPYALDAGPCTGRVFFKQLFQARDLMLQFGRGSSVHWHDRHDHDEERRELDVNEQRKVRPSRRKSAKKQYAARREAQDAQPQPLLVKFESMPKQSSIIFNRCRSAVFGYR